MSKCATRWLWSILAIAPMLVPPPLVWAQDEDEVEVEAPAVDEGLLSGLALRNIGPALMSGRIVDIAVDPERPSTWYLAVASGGVWKTTDAGTTWASIFDGTGAYSVGALAIDPSNRHVVWVGSGENNSQRSVGYGDGVYKTVDGGTRFENVGLPDSEHIGMIRIDPRDSDVVYVAAQGPLWRSGGDRGLYKTTDGGKTWNQILVISDDTGVSEVHLDPRDPDTLYAVAYQRRRRPWTLIDGGPESGLHKSTDGGATWRTINAGLPDVDLGRIGLAVSPIDPDVLYAIVEAAEGEGGVFRSSDRGENWSKRSGYVSSSPQYYQEIVADPHVFDRLYSLDTYLQVSDDGGATWEGLGESDKHVDNHALVTDPEDPDHLLVGCDGGLYETWDRGGHYRYFANLPITQFYKIAVDNAEPFYNVYGGTQDNATQGGPSRTTNVHGIRNSDWFVTVFGDGFDPAVDPSDPNIVYSQWQYGGLIRYDRRTGQQVDIKPQESADGPPLRWNWDSALMISPHDPTRLYYGSQILFRSDDRGDSWESVSPDLTRDLDRNTLEVMGRVWGVDAVAKNDSTSFYGTIVALAESPLVEGLLYVGTDDGLVQISEDGGENWREVDSFAFLEVPERGDIADIEASRHDPDTVYVAVDAHKDGDFKPYLVRSTDRGQTWTLISGGLPEKGTVYSIALDHEEPALLFAGTEFGVFTSLDGGMSWSKLNGGMPPIPVRDLEIQRRENDLVVGTFGRGIAILDDYSPLRVLAGSPELLEMPATIFPIKPMPMYLEEAPLGVGEKAFQGAGFFNAPNPPFGATFTYYLKDALEGKREARRKADHEAADRGEDVAYPSWDELKAEDREEGPAVLLTIADADGRVVRRVEGSNGSGLQRTTWDYRLPGTRPIEGQGDGGQGPLALPGSYSLSIGVWDDGEWRELAGPASFEVMPIGFQGLSDEERAESLAFQRETAELQRVALGAHRALGLAMDELQAMRSAIAATPELGPEVRAEARALELRLEDLEEAFNGDPTRPMRNEPALPGLLARIDQVVSGHWSAGVGPTATHRRSFEIAAEAYDEVAGPLREVIEETLPALGRRLEEAGAPWTPGRPIPERRGD